MKSRILQIELDRILSVQVGLDIILWSMQDSSGFLKEQADSGTYHRIYLGIEGNFVEGLDEIGQDSSGSVQKSSESGQKFSMSGKKFPGRGKKSSGSGQKSSGSRHYYPG